eukprot:3936889-Rhodomonas_salina.2
MARCPVLLDSGRNGCSTHVPGVHCNHPTWLVNKPRMLTPSVVLRAVALPPHQVLLGPGTLVRAVALSNDAFNLKEGTAVLLEGWRRRKRIAVSEVDVTSLVGSEPMSREHWLETLHGRRELEHDRVPSRPHFEDLERAKVLQRELSRVGKREISRADSEEGVALFPF